MILLWLFSFLFAQGPCEGITHTAPDYSSVETKIKSKLLESANLSTIAGEADQVLARLIASKSPVLLNWLRERHLTEASEEKIASLWRQYYLQRFVFEKFPTDNSQINDSIVGVWTDLQQMFCPAPFRNKLEALFNEVKNNAKVLVQRWPLETAAKQKVIHQIDTLKLHWLTDLTTGPYQKSPILFLQDTLHYFASQHKIYVGLGIRRYPTDANLYAVLAHEVAHSFDSCQWGAQSSLSYPFKEVEACLRDSKSVAAQKRDPKIVLKALKRNLIDKNEAQTLLKNKTCNDLPEIEEDWQRDQGAEAFADWMSAEVFAISRFKNQFPRPDLCGEQKHKKTSSILADPMRLKGIYLAHPQLNWGKTADNPSFYCSLKAKPAE